MLQTPKLISNWTFPLRLFPISYRIFFLFRERAKRWKNSHRRNFSQSKQFSSRERERESFLRIFFDSLSSYFLLFFFVFHGNIWFDHFYTRFSDRWQIFCSPFCLKFLHFLFASFWYRNLIWSMIPARWYSGHDLLMTVFLYFLFRAPVGGNKKISFFVSF